VAADPESQEGLAGGEGGGGAWLMETSRMGAWLSDGDLTDGEWLSDGDLAPSLFVFV
jgi:hypothetical protein